MGANFSDPSIGSNNFIDSYLEAVNLRGAKMSWNNFQNTNFKSGIFIRAVSCENNFANVKIGAANLFGVNLLEARLIRALIKGAVEFTTKVSNGHSEYFLPYNRR